METTTVPIVASPRSPKAASRLSDLAIGLGQIYCGHLVRGLALYFTCFVIATVWILLIAMMKGRFTQAFLIGLVPALGMWLFAKFDARRLAARAPADYVRKEYNRWYVYAMLAAIVIPFAVCGAFFIRATAYEAFQVAGASMTPTIRKGERVLVNKTVYDVEPMARGDVVVIRSPDSPRTKLVKRLIALPGDRVEVNGPDIVVNGLKIPRLSSVAATLPSTGPAGTTIELTVPHGHGYFLGDNIDNSYDSRQMGPMPLGNVVGRVEFIYWPRLASVK